MLPDALRERGAEVDVVALYETVREQPGAEAVEAAAGRRLRHLHLLLDRAQPDRGARRPLPDRRPRRLDRPGHQRDRPRRRPQVDVEAERHDIDGLLEALLADADGGPLSDGTKASGDFGSAPPLPRAPTRPTRAPASWPPPAPRTAPSSPPPSRPRAAAARAAPGPPRPARPSSTRRSSARSTSATCCCRSPSRSPSARRPRSCNPDLECQSQVAERRLGRGPQAGRSPDRGPAPGRLGGDRRRPEPLDRATTSSRPSSATRRPRSSTPITGAGEGVRRTLPAVVRRTPPLGPAQRSRSSERPPRPLGRSRPERSPRRAGANATRCTDERSPGTDGSGVADGVDDRGNLLVVTAGGDRVALGAGEVHLTRF